MNECPACYKETDKLKKEICSRCSDILEFGYPSFEGFPLAHAIASQRLNLD